MPAYWSGEARKRKITDVEFIILTATSSGVAFGILFMAGCGIAYLLGVL